MTETHAAPDRDSLTAENGSTVAPKPAQKTQLLHAAAFLLAIVLAGACSAYLTWRVSWRIAETEAQSHAVLSLLALKEAEVREKLSWRHAKSDESENSESFENSDCASKTGAPHPLIAAPKCFQSGPGDYHVSVPGAWIQSVVEDSGNAVLLAGHPDASIRIEVSSKPASVAPANAQLVALIPGKFATVSVERRGQNVEFTMDLLRKAKNYKFRAKVSNPYFDANHDLIWAVAQTFAVEGD